MHSATRQALEDFDNQHEFERLAADVLNSLGFSDVEPIAPLGGADGGRDIKFREGDTAGLAFVTLDKKIREKFNKDLAKQQDGEGKIALFCNVDVTPKMRLTFAKDALDKGYVVDVYDLERLRSLFDSSLTELRRRYLGIDDAIASRLRSEIRKLLRFPDAFPDNATSVSTSEGMLVNQLPRRLFDLLMQYDEHVVMEVPGIGGALHEHLTSYYTFRKKMACAEQELITKIGTLSAPRFRQAWTIHYQYSMMRFGKLSKDDIVAQGDFLNYGITWDAAERVFLTLQADTSVSSLLSPLFTLYEKLLGNVEALLKESDPTRSLSS